jgi:DNA excision repair protein ERCC-5
LFTDIEDALELRKEDLINCALLLGSDYTDGIRGIGAVSAKEIVTHFRGVEGLKNFRDWIVNGIEHGLDEKSRRWFTKHKNLRQKVKTLDQHFPSREVIDAYLHPLVDNSSEQFEWNCPDLDRLREFCTKRFAWDIEQTDLRVVPIVQRYNQTLKTVQKRIETFFLPLMRRDKGPKAQTKVSPASAAAPVGAGAQKGGTDDAMDFGFFEDDEYVRLAEELEGDSPKGPKAKSRTTAAKRKRSKAAKDDADDVEVDDMAEKKRTPPKRKSKKQKKPIVLSDDDDASDGSDGFKPVDNDDDEPSLSDDAVAAADDSPPPTRRPRKMPKRS